MTEITNMGSQTYNQLEVDDMIHEAVKEAEKKLIEEIGSEINTDRYYEYKYCQDKCQTEGRCDSGVGWRNCNYRIWQQLKKSRGIE